MATRCTVAGFEACGPSRGIVHRIARHRAAHHAVWPIGKRPPGFLLSICFDDAPQSAAHRGADLLAAHGLLATWYIATGLLGGPSVSGRIVEAGDVRRLAAAGHEIALHGHAHADMSRMPPDAALADIARNRAALSDILGVAPGGHFAYPFGTTSLALKRRLAGEVPTARGVLPGCNGARNDRLQLAAYDLRPDRLRLIRAMAGLGRAARTGGWVILFTHDVSPRPSPFGIAPETLERLIVHAKALGAQTMPVGMAWKRLGQECTAAP